ncbi:MAG TPA: carboxypeptidase regulatory-like domain-containing protein [Methanomassiliicoccales archaeon]|nr:carboxypeptidase regulatory-like domain-containing protein [Methanomassiliicoccales archaeon]
MNRKLLTLALASLFIACLSSGALAITPAAIGATPSALTNGLIIDTPTNGSRLNSLDITISWHVTGSVSAVQFYLVKVDQGSWINNSLRTSFTLIAPQDGSHQVWVQAWTDIENVYSAIVLFVVDTIPPTVIGHSPTGYGVAVSSFIFASFSEEMDVATVVVTGVQGQTTWAGNDLTLTPSEPLLADHDYNIVINGRDLAGNNLSEYSWSFSTATADQGTLTGQIRDNRNDTVAGASVDLLSKGEIVSSTTTDSDGRFQIDAPGGSYNLTISKSSIVTRTVQVDIAAGRNTDLGVVDVDLTPNSAWILIDVIIVVGAIALFLVGRRNQKLRRKGT